MGTEWALASGESTRLRLVSNVEEPMAGFSIRSRPGKHRLGLIFDGSLEQDLRGRLATAVGHVHPVVEHLVPMPEEEADDLRRGALAVEVDPQIEPPQLSAKPCFAEPERGVSAQVNPELDDAVGFETQLLDRHEPQVGAVREFDLDLGNDHRANIRSSIEQNN